MRNLVPEVKLEWGEKKGCPVSTTAMKTQFKLLAALLSLILASPARAYDYPLSPSAIREAYFLGTRQGSVGPDFLARYGHRIPKLSAGTCTSGMRIETPFLHVADYASKAVNYSAQEAMRDFYDRPGVLRMYLDICYRVEAPPPNSITIKVIQNKKEIAPLSDERTPYAEPADEGSYFPSNGERVRLDFTAKKIDSSTLTIQIATPDGQHAETEFDLQTLR